jgi:DNA-binding response OmpR family regulator
LDCKGFKDAKKLRLGRLWRILAAMGSVLIIETEVELGTTLATALQARGVSAQVLTDGAEALDLLRGTRPDAIVLCVELGRLSGYSICNKLKKDPLLSVIPLVLTSSSATAETFEQHRRLKTHAEAYLKKPYTLEQILAVLGGYLGFAAQSAPSAPPAVVEEDRHQAETQVVALASLQKGAPATAQPLQQTDTQVEAQSPSQPGPPATAQLHQQTDTQVVALDALPPVDLQKAFAAQEFPSEVGELDVVLPAPRAEFEQPQTTLGSAQPAELPAFSQPATPSQVPAQAPAQAPVITPPLAQLPAADLQATPRTTPDDTRVDLRVLRQRVAQLEQQLTQQALTFNEKLLAQSSHLSEAVALKKQVAELTREHARVLETARAEVQQSVREAQAQALAWQTTCAEQRAARQASEQAAQAAQQKQQAQQQQADRDAQKIAHLDAQGRELQAQIDAHAQQKVQVRHALDGAAQLLQVLLPASHP